MEYDVSLDDWKTISWCALNYGLDGRLDEVDFDCSVLLEFGSKDDYRECVQTEKNYVGNLQNFAQMLALTIKDIFRKASCELMNMKAQELFGFDPILFRRLNCPGTSILSPLAHKSDFEFV